MTSRVVVAAAAALALAGPAEAARYAVGVEPGVPYERVASAVEHATATRADRTLEPLGAVVAETTSPARLRALPGVAYVERADASRRTAFVPNDPLAPRQWHLVQDRAFDFWPELPALPGVRVAVIDSGIDATHPDLAARVADSRTFVGGSALTDQQGHGTFIAGLIAAQTNNALGVAGMAFPAQLLVAKVVRANRGVVVEAEAQAIRWAVDNGARVINLSLGGLRDPRDTSRDQFSELEAAAIRYAYTRGVVVVAAIGNSDLAPTSPWPYASYPAALPHVIGVSALAKDGSVPLFSNRDPVYNDVAAPGQELVSTLPRQLTAGRTGCEEQGYSPCGPEEYRNAEGTSFAAPQVAAAAALLLSVRPLLQPSQVAHLLTRNAEDASEANGCRACARGRDAYTGFGRLDVAKALGALQSPLPAPDRFEANDDAGAQAPPLRMQRASFTATVDFWDDQVDVYKIYLRKRQRITITLTGPRGMNTDLVLWKPGTTRVNGLSVSLVRQRAAQSASAGPNERIRHTASSAGWYFVQVKAASAGAGQYRLAFAKR